MAKNQEIDDVGNTNKTNDYLADFFTSKKTK